MEKNLKELIEYPKEGILSKMIYKEGTNVTLFCMTKGTEISKHTSTKQGFIYVLEGKGNFNLEGRDIDMKEGTIIFMKKNAVHYIKSKKNTSFLLILIE